MDLVRSQDRNAFEVVVRRHEDKVFGLATRLIGNREEARDLTQEILIGIWENPESWKPKRNPQNLKYIKFSTWLYRVTYNRALNFLRGRRLKKWISFDFSDSEESNTELLSDALAEKDDPQKVYLNKERREIFNLAFENLNARYRAALHLKYHDNLSTSEIAKSLGVSYKAAESLLFRGKQKLKEIVDQK